MSKQLELSSLGKKLEEVFLAKRTQYSDIRVVRADFGIDWDPETELVVPEVTCVCPLGMAMLGENAFPKEGANFGVEYILQNLFPEMTFIYINGFWNGVDSDNEYSEDTFKQKDPIHAIAYRDGQIFKERYIK